MDPPNCTSGSVQALLDRLRAAQSGAPNGTHDATPQFQTGYAQTMGDASGGSSYSGYRGPSEAASFTSMASGSNSLPNHHVQQQHQQQPHSTFHEDLARSDSVQALLSSLQSARPRPEMMNPSNQMMGYTNHYAPTPAYQHQHPPPPQRQQTFSRPQYAPQNQQRPLPRPQPPTRTEPTFPRFDRSPTTQTRPTTSSTNSIPVSPSRTWAPGSLPEQPSRSPVPPDFSRSRPSVSPRPRPQSASPRAVKVPAKPAKAYDPYDEEYSPPPAEDPSDADAGSPEADDPSLAAEDSAHQEAEETAHERDAEREAAEQKAERDTDEFVEMSFARASAVVTRLMNDESVVRRLRELREEQESLERRLWEKRLEIVKMYREKMNDAKEEAKRMNQAAGDARVMKEKSAAQKALRQYYITRCLPFYDDLHAKHLLVMQLELGIPGLGRLEPRRKDEKGVRGVAERPIAVDSDDDDEGKEKPVVGRGVGSEEAREKMLARRRKIVGLIESILTED